MDREQVIVFSVIATTLILLVLIVASSVSVPLILWFWTLQECIH